MYERILVPLDGSKMGEAVLPVIEELVAKLSSQLKVEVTLLQVVTSLTYGVFAEELSAPVRYSKQDLKAIEKEAQAYLEKAGEGLKSKGAIMKTKVVSGTAAEEIIKAAEETKASLIAMSTHGRSGASRWVLGSVTDKVLRAGKLPVLMVRVPKAKKGAKTRENLSQAECFKDCRFSLRRLTLGIGG